MGRYISGDAEYMIAIAASKGEPRFDPDDIAALCDELEWAREVALLAGASAESLGIPEEHAERVLRGAGG